MQPNPTWSKSKQARWFDITSLVLCVKTILQWMGGFADLKFGRPIHGSNNKINTHSTNRSLHKYTPADRALWSGKFLIYTTRMIILLIQFSQNWGSRIFHRFQLNDISNDTKNLNRIQCEMQIEMIFYFKFLDHITVDWSKKIELIEWVRNRKISQFGKNNIFFFQFSHFNFYW